MKKILLFTMVMMMFTAGVMFAGLNSDLRSAAEKGNLAEVKVLVKKGANINAKGKDKGRTALHRAILKGRLNVAKYLMSKGADIEVKDKNGKTALCLAGERDYFNVVKYLVSVGADVNANDNKGRTTEDIARAKGYTEVVAFLKKAKLYFQAIKAVENYDLARFKSIIEKGLSLNFRGVDDTTFLHIAAVYDSVEIAKHLINNGESVESKEAGGNTPLHIAARFDNIEIAKLFITKRVSKKVTKKPGVRIKNIVAFLDDIERPMQPNNKQFSTEKANINIKNNGGESPLHIAANFGSIEVAKMLIENDANVKQKNRGGDTPLHLAAREGHLDILKLLIAKGANVNGKNKAGQTVLAVAEEHKQAKIVRFLNKDESGDTVDVVVYEKPSSDVDVRIPKGWNPYGKKSMAIVIGNRDYKNGVPRVDYAINDASIMKEYFIKRLYVPKENIIYRENTDLTTLNDIFGKGTQKKSRAYRQAQRIQPKVLYVYYSGHGVPGLKNKKGYLAPVNTIKDNVEDTAYPMELMYSLLVKIRKELGVKKIYVIIDACFSGDSPGGMLIENVSPIMAKVNNPVLIENSGAVFLATSSDDYATWYKDKRHGTFTYFFLKGLRGAADANKNRKITVGEMRKYISSQVPRRANIEVGIEQKPEIKGKSSDEILKY